MSTLRFCGLGLRLLGLAAFLPFLLSAAPAKVCEEKVDLRVAAKNLAWLTCDSGRRGIEADATLFDLSGQKDDPTAAPRQIPGIVTIRLLPGTLLDYSSVEFAADLEPGKEYVLKIVPASILRVVASHEPLTGIDWATLFVAFSTKADVTLINSEEALELGNKFLLNSNVGLKTCDNQKPTLEETNPQEKPKTHDVSLQRVSVNQPGERDSATDSCTSPPNDPQTHNPVLDPPAVGTAYITLKNDTFQQAKAKLNVHGIYDVFGQEVSVPDDSRKVTLKDLPKGKDDATYYLQFSNQAGPGAKPTWSLDVKGAPVFGANFAGFSPTLNVLADVGFGGTDSPNTVTIGGGVTRLFPTGHSPLEAVRFTPTLNLEADRTFAKERNLVFSPDLRFYLPFLNLKRDLRSRRDYVRAVAGKPASEAADVDEDDPAFKKVWGFFTQLWLGMETGGSLIDPTVETDDKTSSVHVPSFGIVRFNPHIQTNFELWRFTLDFQANCRYIGHTEYVGRINSITDPPTGTSTDVAVLDSVHGRRGYGELSLSFAIDKSAHVNFTTTYKRGSAPPSFDKVDVVQSGITLKY